MKISLCMIVKDEEKYIKQCLDNALPLVDEAIIVDTGSTDETINILEKNYKDKVKLIKHVWKNDFSEARNKSLENATGDWILILDADEKLSFDREKLVAQLQDENADGYNIPMYNFLSIDNIVYSAVMPRLIKNDNPGYIGAIHEQIRLNGEPLKTLNTFETSVCKIIHYGYLYENVVKKNKTERNINIIKDELRKDPKNGFQWYNLGITYMGEEKYAQAIDAFINSNKFSQDGRKTYHDSLVLSLGECLYREKNYKQLHNFLDALKEDDSINQYPDYYYYYGKLFEKKKKYNKAIENFEKSIKIGEMKNSISKKGMGSFTPNIEIARILLKQKKINDAVMKYMEAVFCPDNFSLVGLQELKELLTKENMHDILEELEKLIGEKNENKENNQLVNINEDTKKQLKEDIQRLIEKGLLEDAKKLLNGNENIFSNDVEIYSIKAVISIMEKNTEKALEVINKGLAINPDYVDLLYNKAYLLEQNQKYKESYKLYKSILYRTDSNEFKKGIKNKLEEIKSIDSYVDLNGKLSVLAINKDIKSHIVNYITNWLHEFGFTILETLEANDSRINNHDIKQYIILYDLNPVDMNRQNEDKYPLIDNERYFLINYLEKDVYANFQMKSFSEKIYLTQNEKEAKNIVEQLLSDRVEELYKRINDIELNYETNYPVIKLFDGFRLRAKTELIQYGEGLAVKKTWKPGNKKFLQREKFACAELSKNISYIPPLLESGENYIIIPYYEDILQKDETTKKIVLTNNIIDISTFFKQLYEAGYFNPDIHPGHFIFSEKDGLKAIDFEYLQRYEQKPTSFVDSYDIKGYPKDFLGDKPSYTVENLHELYDRLWVHYTGYNLEQIGNLILRGKYNYNDVEINKVIGLLNYAKTSGKSYNGSLYGSAYHSLRLKDYYFRGQRECNLRLQKLPFDFTGKIVLDIGCNAGGMLHAISDKVKVGVGIDYDYRLVNAANSIKTINKTNNLSFYRFDLENEDLNLINNFILCENDKVDICFLLSVCMWINNWREVITYASLISKNLLFETNGTQQQQLEQIEELKKHYNNIKIIEEESNDDPGQPNRILLLCNNEKKRSVVIESNNKYYEKLLEMIIKPEYDVVYHQASSPEKTCKIYVENSNSKAIDFNEYMNDFFDFEFYRNYFNLIENKDNARGFITGLSYFEVGIEENKLKNPFINLALSSQDLFYDFAMLKYAIDDLDTSENLEQVIIGLSNYSFRYDLSMVQNPQTREKPKVYYPLVKNLHNYSNKSEVIDKYNTFEKEFNHLFKKNYLFEIFQYGKDNFNMLWSNMTNRKFEPEKLSQEEKQREIYLAQRWNQGYSHTVEENIKILREMLKYLKNKSIKVVIVTNPVTEFHKSYFPQNCREEFLHVIGELKKEFEFTFIDCYNMNSFNNSDFYDASHLNKLGAEKFTELINESLLQDDMIIYQEKLKKNIGILIENDMLGEAKKLLRQYEDIVSNDIEIYSIKSVICITEGNIDEAESVIKEGLLLDDRNFDLNYNLAYICEVKKKYLEAYKHYNEALKNCDSEIKNQIEEKLRYLEKTNKL